MTVDIDSQLTAFKTELEKIDAASTDTYDKAILANAAGALGLSMAFIQNVVHVDTARFVPCLLGSWAAFALAILLVILSFRLQHWGIERYRKRIDGFIEGRKGSKLDDEQEAALLAQLPTPKRFNHLLSAVNSASGGSFLVGMVLTAIFVSSNLYKPQSAHSLPTEKSQQEPQKMSNPSKPTTHTSVPTGDAAPIPTFAITPAPAPAPAPTPTPTPTPSKN